MAIKLFLNSQTIINHVFPVVSRNAYDATEVDRFVNEYETLKQKNKVLESDKRKLEVELERYKARFTNIKSSDNVTTDNIELVRKINALEKFLWNHGFNPDTIK